MLGYNPPLALRRASAKVFLTRTAVADGGRMVTDGQLLYLESGRRDTEISSAFCCPTTPARCRSRRSHMMAKKTSLASMFREHMGKSKVNDGEGRGGVGAGVKRLRWGRGNIDHGKNSMHFRSSPRMRHRNAAEGHYSLRARHSLILTLVPIGFR